MFGWLENLDLPDNLKKTIKISCIVAITLVLLVGLNMTLDYFTKQAHIKNNQIQQPTKEQLVSAGVDIKEFNAKYKLASEKEKQFMVDGANMMLNKTMDPIDKGTLFEHYIIDLDYKSKETILYIYFDKNSDYATDMRENITKYQRNKKSYPVKVFYTNIESSLIAGQIFYSKLLPQGEQVEFTPTVLLSNGKVVEYASDFYNKLPLEGGKMFKWKKYTKD